MIVTFILHQPNLLSCLNRKYQVSHQTVSNSEVSKIKRGRKWSISNEKINRPLSFPIRTQQGHIKTLKQSAILQVTNVYHKLAVFPTTVARLPAKDAITPLKIFLLTCILLIFFSVSINNTLLG